MANNKRSRTDDDTKTDQEQTKEIYLVSEALIESEEIDESDIQSRAFNKESEAREYMKERAKELYYECVGGDPDEEPVNDNSDNEEIPFDDQGDVIYFNNRAQPDNDFITRGVVKIEKVNIGSW